MSAPRHLWAMVLAGGQGTRFWPRSRARLPKQLLPIAGDESLLRRTLARLPPRVDPERTFVVTARDQVEALMPHAGAIPRTHVVAEPAGRNTAAAIGLGLAAMRRAGMPDDAVVAVLPADHAIARPDVFREVLGAAAAAAGEAGAICTIGLAPDRPDTGYGYLKVGARLSDGAHPVHRLDAFIEKPDHGTATRLLQEGGHLWNGGMFMFPAALMRAEIARHLPAHAAALERIEALWGASAPEDEVARVYGEVPAISIDYGVMEKAGGLLVVPGDFGWSDVGNWSRIPDAMPEGEGGWVTAGRLVSLDSAGNVVDAPGKMVALLGVRDLVVVDTDDVLMILPRDRAEEVRLLLQRVRERGWEDCL